VAKVTNEMATKAELPAPVSAALGGLLFRVRAFERRAKIGASSGRHWLQQSSTFCARPPIGWLVSCSLLC